MAAGRQRKRLESSNLHELRGKKKKKIDSSEYILNLRSHIHLEWDNAQKRVVAKREQIGIPWKDMSPFVDSAPKFHSGLADVFSLPKEVFNLDNLMDVVSHKVWMTCLSVSERKLLMEFLPSCDSTEKVVQSLLSGENINFGNSFLKWSTLLCSGDLHPDVLLQKERQTRLSKKQYNLEINKYHANMVSMFRMLKEKSETCEDPEKFWRKLSIQNNSGEGASAEMPDGFPIHKKDLPMKMCNHHADVAKYMSYIKVNKKQLKMIKELKNSGDHIRSKSISRVLGDIKNFQIYPYESYEDEENKKLQKHWVQVTKDTLPALEKFNKRKFMKIQRMKCLEKELTESRAFIYDKAEKSVLGSSPEYLVEAVRETEHHSALTTVEGDFHFHSLSSHDCMLDRIPSLNALRELDSSISDQKTGTENTVKPAKDESVDKMYSFQIPKSTLISSSNYQKPSEAVIFTSSAAPIHQCQHFKVQPVPIFDPERASLQTNAGRPLSSAFNVETTSQMFNSYSQRRVELSRLGPQFVMNNGNPPGTNCFSLLNDKQMHNKECHAHKKELFARDMIDDNICAKIRDWLPNEHQPHRVWSGIESSGSGVESSGGNVSRLSVPSEFRDFPCRSSFESSGLERVLPARNYVGVSSMPDPFTMASSSPLDIMWMNYSHQNTPSLQESVRKVFMWHRQQ
ncbi:uncharacterized protein LOC110029642 [Phalaenopsis equestris]|uniref:uncharacterized protein LOC110029642 n=1 Tax=Phalaenopsis equestris TaxID=78828 RepID=UPI0009E34EDF|nr:uncharacterized protein LOC110029642 [Phalaenopsis equestris]XP_020587685.1 uncharacterized protein LOC110029642 [Phalaenopsis equestris]